MSAIVPARRAEIVVVGSVNADLVVHTEHAPRAGETVQGHDFRIFPGGKGANQAAALGRLETAVAVVGCVGDDSFGVMLRQALVEANVKCAALGTVDAPTGVALITTERSGENRIAVVAGANGWVTPQTIEQHRELIEDARVLLLQLELPLPAVVRAAELAHAAGVMVLLDPAPAQALPECLLRLVTWLTPNQTEANVLLGGALDAEENGDEQRTAQALLARGVANVVLKLGEKGCFAAASNGARIRVPAFSVDAVDTTAAGDAFNAGFAAALLRGVPLEVALREASATAALSVMRHGAMPSLPTRAELDYFLRWSSLQEEQS